MKVLYQCDKMVQNLQRNDHYLLWTYCVFIQKLECI